MNNIDFRPATIEELSILYEFEQGIITTERPFDPTLKSEHINYYDLRAMIISENDEVMVAVVDGQIVASAYVKIKEASPYLKFDNYAYVGFVYVRPEFRGAGLGQQIINACKPWAVSKGLNELRLKVYNDNQPAIRAYEKLGLKKHIIEMRMKI